MFLGGFVALAMPLIHRNNGFTPAVAKAPGGIFFVWTLVALGVTGALTMILAARGLLRRPAFTVVVVLCGIVLFFLARFAFTGVAAPLPLHAGMGLS